MNVQADTINLKNTDHLYLTGSSLTMYKLFLPPGPIQ